MPAGVRARIGVFAVHLADLAVEFTGFAVDFELDGGTGSGALEKGTATAGTARGLDVEGEIAILVGHQDFQLLSH